MSYNNFNTFKSFKNVGINSSSNYALSMKSTGNNISFHSSNSIDYNNVDIMSIKNIINKKQNEDLNLSSLNGTTINPVITINNNHSDCRIMTNLNVAGNLNINNNLIIPNDENSTLIANIEGSIYYNTSENMYKGYSNTEGWQPLGGFSKTKDATIHKNLNVAGNVNITKNVNVSGNLNINSTGSIKLPAGATTERPSNPIPGTIRYNNATLVFEGYSAINGGVWIAFSTNTITSAFIELALIGGGGAGGDGKYHGGGGGGGALVQASGTFPLNLPFTLQLGRGGLGPTMNYHSGNAGHMTELKRSGFELRAYGGGRGASYNNDAFSNAEIHNNWSGGSGAGGSGAENDGNDYSSGDPKGALGSHNDITIVSDLDTEYFGGDGADFLDLGHNNDGGNFQYTGQGGHGGGAGGNATAGLLHPFGPGSGLNPKGKNSDIALWKDELNWGKGGYGCPPFGGVDGGYASGHIGNSVSASLVTVGTGGAGSGNSLVHHSQAARSGQWGRIGGAIINVPAGISIDITESTNIQHETATINGGTSYIFYDDRWFITQQHANGGSCTITFKYA